MHACMRARVRVYACKTRVRGEEIISSLERARESEGEGRGKERERESRRQFFAPRECILADRLHGPRPFFSTRSSSRLERSTLQRLFEFCVFPRFSSRGNVLRSGNRDEAREDIPKHSIGFQRGRNLEIFFRKLTFFLLSLVQS